MFSAVQFDDVALPPPTELSISCIITGISQNTPITWIGPDDIEISDSDTNNYVINQGTYVFGSKASTLNIKEAKLSTLSTESVFKCKLKSALYPTISPEVVKEMTLTFLELGWCER